MDENIHKSHHKSEAFFVWKRRKKNKNFCTTDIVNFISLYKKNSNFFCYDSRMIENNCMGGKLLKMLKIKSILFHFVNKNCRNFKKIRLLIHQNYRVWFTCLKLYRFFSYLFSSTTIHINDCFMDGHLT